MTKGAIFIAFHTLPGLYTITAINRQIYNMNSGHIPLTILMNDDDGVLITAVFSSGRICGCSVIPVVAC